MGFLRIKGAEQPPDVHLFGGEIGIQSTCQSIMHALQHTLGETDSQKTYMCTLYEQKDIFAF